MIKLTKFGMINTDIGPRLAVTYSEINDAGIVVQSNVNKSFVVTDDVVLHALSLIQDFALMKCENSQETKTLNIMQRQIDTLRESNKRLEQLIETSTFLPEVKNG